MPQAVKDFFAKHSYLSHILVTAWLALSGFYTTNTEARTYVNNFVLAVYHRLPKGLEGFIAALIVPLLVYVFPKLALTLKGKVSMAQRAVVAAGVTVDDPTGASSTQKLGAIAVAFLMLSSLLASTAVTTGCSAVSVEKVVALVGAQIPNAIAVEGVVAGIVETLSPGIAPVIVATNPLIVAGLTELKVLCDNYTADPSASIWASIVAVMDKLVTDGDTMLLSAARIVDPSTQAKVTGIISGLDALFHAIDGLVQSARPTSAVVATVNARKVKLALVAGYWSGADKATVASILAPVDGNLSFDALYKLAVQKG